MNNLFTIFSLFLLSGCAKNRITTGQKLTQKYYDIETRRMKKQNTKNDISFMKKTYKVISF